MERLPAIVSIALVAVGLVWIGQGLGIIRTASFMIDDPRWAAIGAGCVVGGLGLAGRTILLRRRG